MPAGRGAGGVDPVDADPVPPAVADDREVAGDVDVVEPPAGSRGDGLQGLRVQVERGEAALLEGAEDDTALGIARVHPDGGIVGVGVRGGGAGVVDEGPGLQDGHRIAGRGGGRDGGQQEEGGDGHREESAHVRKPAESGGRDVNGGCRIEAAAVPSAAARTPLTRL